MRRYLILHLVLVAYLSADIKDTINFVGKEKMLTQKITKEALLIAKGVDVNLNIDRLKSSIELFEKILYALFNGDRDLKIEKTLDRDILEELDRVKNAWFSFREDITKIINGDIDRDRLKSIDKQNRHLLELVDIVVKMYQEKSNIEPHLAQTIHLVDKERVLSQKMAKELLLIANNIKSNKNIDSLKSSGELFKETLNRLIKNREHLNDKELVSRLSNIQKLWIDYQKTILNIEFTRESRIKTKNEIDNLKKELTKELLYVANRIDKQLYRKELAKTGKMFDTILDGLIEGNSTLGLTKIESSKITKELSVVKEIWNRYRPIIYEGNTSKEALNISLKLNDKLLEQIDKVVTLYSNLNRY